MVNDKYCTFLETLGLCEVARVQRGESTTARCASTEDHQPRSLPLFCPITPSCSRASFKGWAGRSSNARVERVRFYNAPSKLARCAFLEGHPCWSRCGRRTRPFSGRAFREHRANVGVLPILLIVRVPRAGGRPAHPSPLIAESRRAATSLLGFA